MLAVPEGRRLSLGRSIFFLTREVRFRGPPEQLPDAARFEASAGDVLCGSRTDVAVAAPFCARRRVSMKYAIVTFLVIASSAATVTVAQDGGGQGPPKPKSVVIINPLPIPTSPTTAPVPTTSQPRLR